MIVHICCTDHGGRPLQWGLFSLLPPLATVDRTTHVHSLGYGRDTRDPPPRPEPCRSGTNVTRTHASPGPPAAPSPVETRPPCQALGRRWQHKGRQGLPMASVRKAVATQGKAGVLAPSPAASCSCASTAHTPPAAAVAAAAASPAACAPPEHHKERRFHRHEGSGNTRQRQCLTGGGGPEAAELRPGYAAVGPDRSCELVVCIHKAASGAGSRSPTDPCRLAGHALLGYSLGGNRSRFRHSVADTLVATTPNHTTPSLSNGDANGRARQ